MDKKTGLFTWWLPDTPWVNGVIICPRKFGGCGRQHLFQVDENGEIAFDLSYESAKGDLWCEKFDDLLREEAENEWATDLKSFYLREILGEEPEDDEPKEEPSDLQAPVSQGVKISEREWDEGLGAYRSVGYRKGKKEYFTCSKCEKVLPGAGKTGEAKNRNNPTFWGLETEEKVLCLQCVKNNYYPAIASEKSKTLRKYLKRGYV